MTLVDWKTKEQKSINKFCPPKNWKTDFVTNPVGETFATKFWIPHVETITFPKKALPEKNKMIRPC
jgi:hypothetical protein